MHSAILVIPDRVVRSEIVNHSEDGFFAWLDEVEHVSHRVPFPTELQGLHLEELI